MSFKSLLAAAAFLAVAAAAPLAPAMAFGDHYSRYRDVREPDPYAYRYAPRGYYPWYSSPYWVPARIVRIRKHLHYYHWAHQPPRFRYYPAWGYPSKTWRHYEWHRRHHGRHRLHHW
jgi:hypothetical protein